MSFTYPLATLILATALLLVVAGWDMARRRIPNWANAALGLTGLGAQAIHHGAGALLGALAAAFVTLTVLWSPWSKGRLGGGDVKATVCAAIWLGLGWLIQYLLISAISVGLFALASYLLSTRAAREEIRTNLELAALRAMPDAPIRGGNGRVSVPFGAAAVASALLLLWWS
jgi:Flp pilus assembly protein protease CpaA